ncbi:uncharacterized protein LOC129610355 isoform X2 [Condylostylus longicornis]|uniref:uncharacterized protein LOC129610355 isoform X2 n=1 Tax=Condylostylus longicornis TaxID=2530218 RepID=UPI00244DAB20|nr:uncharacterized protein LOC129610355 isoform X2 [Condylostylus longicornis]
MQKKKIKIFENLQRDLQSKLHSKYLGEVDDHSMFIPYEGYKGSLDENISSASVACTFISKHFDGKRYGKILANRHIPTGKIIAFEKPLDREYYTPILQCEYCFQLTTILYTCFKCHQKYYCRLQCLKDDLKIHQYECCGLRNGLLYSMDATMLFRLFIKSLSYIQTYIFSKNTNAPDIHDFFELVMDNIKFGPQARIKKVLSNFDSYKTVDNSEIYSMATYALRLAVYAVERTSILEDFFSNVQFEKADLLVFIASILLRLQNQVKINSVELGYVFVHPENIQNIEVQPCQSEVFNPNFSRKNSSQTIFEYCNYSENEAQIEALQLIAAYAYEARSKTGFIRYRNIQLPTKVTRKFMNQAYIDNVGNADHEFTLEEKLNIAYRATKEILHIRMNTFNTNLSDNTSAATMQGVYPVVTKFRHSCDSNATPILLESGALLIKANKEIWQGEEITLSYLADYKYYPNSTRKQLQAYLKFNCNCKFCVEDIDFWKLNNSIYCYMCRKIIEGSKCITCNIDKQKTCAIYDDICKSVRNTINRSLSDDVKALKYLILFDQIQSLMYRESHYNVFISNLEVALTCVQRNFVYDAYVLLKKFFYQIPSILGEWNFQHLVYLTMILDKLICILNGNISHNESFVKSNLELFYNILSLANKVAKKLMDQHDFLEIFNFTTFNVLMQYQLLIRLKYVLFDYEYQNLQKPVVIKDDECELPMLEAELSEDIQEIVSGQKHGKECQPSSNSEEINFFVKEDLSSIMTNFNNNEIIDEEGSFNFISPDMTGNNTVIQETDLRKIIEDNPISKK